MADPGEGPGWPLPLIFRPNWDPKGRKILFSRPILRPLSKGLDQALYNVINILIFYSNYYYYYYHHHHHHYTSTRGRRLTGAGKRIPGEREKQKAYSNSFPLPIWTPATHAINVTDRFWVTVTAIGEREFVPRDQFPLFMSFTGHNNYTEISRFIPVLSITMVFSGFHRLIFYFENFLTLNLTFAVCC